jgi:ATPase family associated with various cellular activities (AAA)
MQLTLPTTFVDDMIVETKSKYLTEARKNTRFARKVELDSKLIERPHLKIMMQAARDQELRFTQVLESAWAMSKVHKSEKFSTIREAFDSLKTFFEKALTLNGWLYSRDSAGIFQPWAITEMILHTSKVNTTEYDSHFRIVLQCVDILTNQPTAKHLSLSLSGFASFLSDLDLDREEDIIMRTVKVRQYRDESYDHLVGVEVSDKEKRPSVLQLLEHWEMHAETEELNEIYAGYLKRFKAFLPMYGKQFIVRGTSTLSHGGYWGVTEVDMTKDGQPGRAIMTTLPAAATINSEQSEDHERPRARFGFRATRRRVSEDDSQSWLRDPKTLDIPLAELTEEDFRIKVDTLIDGKKGEVRLPIDPSLNVYHLEKHELFLVHASNMAPYKYKEDIAKMLVLPEEMKELCEMLVSTDGEEGDDVIVNKGQATVIACIGDPGLGKTLMAEVLSEQCKKPLYKIQAAQLGLTPEDLETTLVGILKKAEVWGCVLLIDEANAYIHERGHDIRQNAIVGVFLRLLEYFKGICILTTNHSNERGEIDIDDAIVSRCSAVIPFEVPTIENAKKIWKIQSKLLKANLSDILIHSLVSNYRLSGRSIRQLLRLSLRLANRYKQDLDIKHFEACSKYISVTRSERIGNEKLRGEKKA